LCGVNGMVSLSKLLSTAESDSSDQFQLGTIWPPSLDKSSYRHVGLAGFPHSETAASQELVSGVA
jgi:hypothetical protein